MDCPFDAIVVKSAHLVEVITLGIAELKNATGYLEFRTDEIVQRLHLPTGIDHEVEGDDIVEVIHHGNLNEFVGKRLEKVIISVVRVKVITASITISSRITITSLVIRGVATVIPATSDSTWSLGCRKLDDNVWSLLLQLIHQNSAQFFQITVLSVDFLCPVSLLWFLFYGLGGRHLANQRWKGNTGNEANWVRNVCYKVKLTNGKWQPFKWTPFWNGKNEVSRQHWQTHRLTHSFAFQIGQKCQLPNPNRDNTFRLWVWTSVCSRSTRCGLIRWTCVWRGHHAFHGIPHKSVNLANLWPTAHRILLLHPLHPHQWMPLPPRHWKWLLRLSKCRYHSKEWWENICPSTTASTSLPVIDTVVPFGIFANSSAIISSPSFTSYAFKVLRVCSEITSLQGVRQGTSYHNHQLLPKVTNRCLLLDADFIDNITNPDADCDVGFTACLCLLCPASSSSRSKSLSSSALPVRCALPFQPPSLTTWWTSHVRTSAS